MNRRKEICGLCGMVIPINQGKERFGRISHKKYFICKECLDKE